MQHKTGRTAQTISHLFWILVVFLQAGCSITVQPWEKGNLARPEMGFDHDLLRKANLEHVYASKEAASGGTGVAGGGCGCN